MAEFVTKIRTDEGDKQIDYNALANLPELNTMFSNPNLLINSDFRNPVNQRGATTYQEASDWTYCIDRWKYFNQMTVEVLTGAVKFASHGTGQSWFMQEFEKELPTDNYTLSVKVSSVSGTCDMKFENSSGVQVEKVIDGTGITTLSFNGVVGAVSFELDGDGSQLTIEWVKLEAGSIATPFVPRLYAEELSTCERYYKKYGGYMVFPQFYSNQYYGFYFNVPMRVSPYVASFSAMNTDGSEAYVGSHVEVSETCVRKLFAQENYTSTSIMLELLELDAEIY